MGASGCVACDGETHSVANVVRTRRFFDAVLAYTGATRLDVIAYDGADAGAAGDPRGLSRTNLGLPLTGAVDAFVGISGANRGLTNCYFTSALPTCDASTGLFRAR